VSPEPNSQEDFRDAVHKLAVAGKDGTIEQRLRFDESTIRSKCLIVVPEVGIEPTRAVKPTGF
jgi:hypothetical protein